MLLVTLIQNQQSSHGKPRILVMALIQVTLPFARWLILVSAQKTTLNKRQFWSLHDDLHGPTAA